MFETEWDGDQKILKIKTHLSPLARYRREFDIETQMQHKRWYAICGPYVEEAATEIKAICRVALRAGIPSFDEWRLNHNI